LLEQHPAARLLVTSQRPLGVYGECELVVQPLAEPDAVALFVERARARVQQFDLTQASTATVVEICRRLDGLPLAIELAAARVKILPPEALLRRLVDRLGLLTGGPRDLGARHQTLRAAIDWSYQLLAPGEQRVLQRLAVFAGSFSLSAAEAVVGNRSVWVLDALQALIDTGLLRVESDDGEPRYRMLETVREYATERLVESGDAEAARQRYADYYVAPGAHDTGRASRLAPADEDNLRDALESVLADSLEISRRQHDRHQEALALDGLGGLAAARGDLDLARARYEQSARLFRDIGDHTGAAIARLHLGQVALQAGQHAEARHLLETAIARLRAVGERGPAVAAGLDGLARLAAAQEQGGVEERLGLLTAREREVAGLLAVGLTNREIGERLVISERTAEGHVEHLRTKLGYSSRAQIAAWASHLGLGGT
jgi:predicted ATPase/DNA-binding CsgD family transcriptional regulator